MKLVTLIVIGAGSRGTTYARYATAFPEEARVVGVAEPRDLYRNAMIQQHSIPSGHAFTDWREVAKVPKFADAVIIATQDKMHAEPAMAFANMGYHILLEKPMAPNPADCRRIVQAVKSNGVHMAVCHVMRYTGYTQKLKTMVDAGLIGDVVNIQSLEPVGFWHMAHSFVRGNWRNEAESGFMLLTKSCHDLDWIRYLMGVPCQAVSSFGSLKHFRKVEQPLGAADRCLDCQVEGQCPYSARRIYLEALARGHTGWPVDILVANPTPEKVLEALRTGPYGRCVYACDNDVVDNQVVNFQFEGGRSASFTMMAFTEMGHRQTRIFGTRGQLTGDGQIISHYDFLTDQTEVIDTAAADSSILGGHGGGDFGLMQRFIQALAKDDSSLILSGPDASLESHLMVFGAEQARRHATVVHL
ncbi:MAG: Gfo/Idh/MocA family oxidoreductase [Anaerolineae bacterium]|nr:Gfo/Idh/MocA family oxidoreductase [Anaerolineae bacterium]